MLIAKGIEAISPTLQAVAPVKIFQSRVGCNLHLKHFKGSPQHWSTQDIQTTNRCAAQELCRRDVERRHDVVLHQPC